MCHAHCQAKLKRLEMEYTKLEDRVQKELRSKESWVKKPLTVVGALKARVDAPGSAISSSGNLCNAMELLSILQPDSFSRLQTRK